MSTPIRVMIVDDQVLFREGLRTLLSLQRDIRVVAEAGNGREALEAALAHTPDVVLMDMNMPVLDGVAATRALREQAPSCRVIMLTTFDDDETVFNGLRAGALGYLLKDTPGEKLFEAIRIASRGESFLAPNIAARVVAEFARVTSNKPKTPALTEPLSERETEILKLLADGASNKEIGQALFITEGTVKNHVSNVLGKLGARDRTQAALRARELGLF
jgi:DNA-binding NarL/FixJ family response regulator